MQAKFVFPAIATVHVLLSLVVSSQYSPWLSSLLILSPANSFFIHFYLWNIITYPLADSNFILSCINALVLLVAGRYVQRRFNRTTYSLLGFVVIASGFTIFWIEMLLFVFTRWESFLFHEFNGMSGISSALVIALKFLLGKKPILQNSLPGLKFNHLPFILLILSFVFFATGGILAKDFLPICFGMYFSWLYIRFFRVDQSTDLVGNVSVDFQLDALFPAPLRPSLAAVFAVFFQIAVVLGFFSTYMSQNDMFIVTAERANLQPKPAVPGSDSAAMDRRKKLGMQAIEEQLASKSTGDSKPRSPSPELHIVESDV